METILQVIFIGYKLYPISDFDLGIELGLHITTILKYKQIFKHTYIKLMNLVY
jgi:hypothetical protein